MALSGGVNLITGIHNYLDLTKAGFLSPTGQCKPFDASADGYCRSEGAGLVVLRGLNQALTDGDQIFGVVAGASTNQGGLSPALTIPHSAAQVSLYQNILHQAGMKPEQVSYCVSNFSPLYSILCTPFPVLHPLYSIISSSARFNGLPL